MDREYVGPPAGAGCEFPPKWAAALQVTKSTKPLDDEQKASLSLDTEDYLLLN